jgi:hypothetical protein
MKKFLLLLFITITLGILPILTQEHKEKIFVAKVEFGNNIENLSETKVEAALNLIQRLTNRFELIHNDIRDSIAKILESEGKPPTVLEIGKRSNATRALFFKINRLANILRVDISAYNFLDSSSISGKGYAPIHYKLMDKNEPLYDPALLSATQRAIADLLRDSLMFWGLSGSFKVKPVPTLVIASINYIESDSLKKWEIFRKRQVSSFFAIESIFEEARLSNDFVVFDAETRDSVYALHNFFEPENFSAPSPIEIRALYNLEVEFLLTGELFTESNSVKIRLYLCKIDKDGLIIEKQAEEILPEDNLEKFSQTLKLLTSKLLKIME